jgi:hypothetical protein
VFSFKNDMRMPEGTMKAKAFTQKILHQLFKDCKEFAETKAGRHSVCKYSSSTAQNNGCTKDGKDLRERWKSSQRISDIYDDVELPFPDAKVAGLLCPGGPIRYAILPGSGVTRAFIVDHVTPKICDKYGSDVACILGTALLWVVHSPYFSMVPPFTMRDDLCLRYDEVKTAGFTNNPVQKVPLIICGDEGQVHMVDDPKAYQGGQQPAGGANNNALPMGFQDCPIQDQMQVLYLQNAILGRGFSELRAAVFSELRAAVENNAATNLRNYNQLNRNINRIAMEPWVIEEFPIQRRSLEEDLCASTPKLHMHSLVYLVGLFDRRKEESMWAI